MTRLLYFLLAFALTACARPTKVADPAMVPVDAAGATPDQGQRARADAARPERPQTEAPMTNGRAMARILAAGVTRPKAGDDVPSRVACREAYAFLADQGPAVQPYLLATMESENRREAMLAMWLLGALGPPSPAVEARVTGVATEAWTRPHAACMSKSTPSKAAPAKGARSRKRRCDNRLAGGRPPLEIRLACETLARWKSTRGAHAIAATGAYGYFLHGCIPYLVHHAGDSKAVFASLLLESGLNPNGDLVRSVLVSKGAAAIPSLMGMLEARFDNLKDPEIEEWGCTVAEFFEALRGDDGLTAPKAIVDDARGRVRRLAAKLPKPPKVTPEDDVSRPVALSLCVRRVRGALAKVRVAAPKKMEPPMKKAPPMAKKAASSAPRAPSPGRMYGPFCPKRR